MRMPAGSDTGEWIPAEIIQALFSLLNLAENRAGNVSNRALKNSIQALGNRNFIAVHQYSVRYTNACRIVCQLISNVGIYLPLCVGNGRILGMLYVLSVAQNRRVSSIVSAATFRLVWHEKES